MNPKKVLLKDTSQLAKDKGGKCLSKEYINSSAMMSFVCSEGHKFKSCRDYIKAGSWCPTCAGKRRTIKDMRLLAKDNEGRFLSLAFNFMTGKYLWECKEGHQWESTATNIKSGKWCPVCGRTKSDLNRRKYTIDDMNKLADERDGECLSSSFEGVTKKLIWKCKYGHSWEAMPHGIMSGHWCPPCGQKTSAEKRTIHSIERSRIFAERKGGKCLSNKYSSVKESLEWECSEGHQWEANVDNIMNGGKWCPHCAGNVTRVINGRQSLHL